VVANPQYIKESPVDIIYTKTYASYQDLRNDLVGINRSIKNDRANIFFEHNNISYSAASRRQNELFGEVKTYSRKRYYGIVVHVGENIYIDVPYLNIKIIQDISIFSNPQLDLSEYQELIFFKSSSGGSSNPPIGTLAEVEVPENYPAHVFGNHHDAIFLKLYRDNVVAPVSTTTPSANPNGGQNPNGPALATPSTGTAIAAGGPAQLQGARPTTITTGNAQISQNYVDTLKKAGAVGARIPIKEDIILPFSVPSDFQVLDGKQVFTANDRRDGKVKPIIAHGQGLREYKIFIAPLSYPSTGGISYYTGGSGPDQQYLQYDACIYFEKMMAGYRNWWLQYYKTKDILLEEGRKAGLTQNALNRLISPYLASAFRTYQTQVNIVNKGLPAAKAGTSNHETGLAVDIHPTNRGGSNDVGQPVIGPFGKYLMENAYVYGFRRTVGHESWHWEFRPQWIGVRSIEISESYKNAPVKGYPPPLPDQRKFNRIPTDLTS